MKKLILAGLCVLSVSVGNSAFAQTFSFPKDTVRYAVQGYAGTEDIKNDIKNETSGSLTLTWKMISENMPPSWESAFGLCDNVLCYSTSIIGSPSSKVQTTAPIAAGTTMPFKMSMDFNGVEKGSYYVTVNITDGTTSKDMTFIMEKFPTSVSSATRNADGVSVYPNPASDELNVLFNANSGIKTITVYNMIGKAVTAYKVSAANSAKLDIQNIPAGIYFIRLTDTQGRVVATRKFTRQ